MDITETKTFRANHGSAFGHASVVNERFDSGSLGNVGSMYHLPFGCIADIDAAIAVLHEIRSGVAEACGLRDTVA